MTQAQKNAASKKQQPEIRLITLSTCFFCSTLKKQLKEAGYQYSFTDLDLLPESERDEQMEELRKFNPEESFPITIIDNVAIVGYQEERIKKELGLS
ncbi:MAG TPA: glutaredoxin family protein [Desulfobulbaceae bacterium]|nr:glutaredoxin family protein [Desulfobulbaceae bacterium]